MNILLYKQYNQGLTEIRTRVSGFKVLSDNHYTMRPQKLYTGGNWESNPGPLANLKNTIGI